MCLSLYISISTSFIYSRLVTLLHIKLVFVLDIYVAIVFSFLKTLLLKMMVEAVFYPLIFSIFIGLKYLVKYKLSLSVASFLFFSHLFFLLDEEIKWEGTIIWRYITTIRKIALFTIKQQKKYLTLNLYKV